MNAKTWPLVDVDTLRVQVMWTDAELELAALRICPRQPVDASSAHESRTIFAPILKHSPGTGAAEDFGRAVERDERRIAPYRRRQQFDETFEYGASELILSDRQTMSSSSLLPVCPGARPAVANLVPSVISRISPEPSAGHSPAAYGHGNRRDESRKSASVIRPAVPPTPRDVARLVLQARQKQGIIPNC